MKRHPSPMAGRDTFVASPRFFAVLLLVAALAGCGSDDSADKTTGNAAQARLPFDGVRLRLVVADDPELAESIGRLRGEWRGATGAEVEIDETTESALLGAGAPEADAIIYPVNDLGVLVENDWLLPLAEQSLAGREIDWTDILESDKTHDACWGATVYGIPFGSPVLVCWYRADLLKTLDRQPPETWQQYQELAQLLADRSKLGSAVSAEQTAWSGTVEPLAEGWAGLTLLARAAAYAKHRNHYSALFDMRTMEPLIAGPPFVRALDELVAAAKLGPADALEITPRRAMNTFAEGKCGLALAWPSLRGANTSEPAEDEAPEAGSDADEAADAIGDDRFGCFELPGTEDVYNPQSETWETRRDDESRRVPLLGMTGRVGSVVKGSRHADAAVHLLGWLAGPQWSGRISTASQATALFRRSQVEKSRQWVEPRLAEAAADYAGAVERSLTAAEYLGAPRLPGRRRYLAALDDAVRSVVAGEASSDDALRAAADEWRKVTDEFGVEAQRAAYRRSLGLR